MRNSIKSLRPKANSLVNLPAFIQYEDVTKSKELGNALSELIEKESFPLAIQKFLELPKFKELVERLKEGTLEGGSLNSKEIHSLQLLLESFHKLVHLDYDFEEIEHPVVQAKVLEKNIQDYLACIDLFFPYEGTIINDILSDLFQTVHFFTGKLKSTILEDSHFFSLELTNLMNSEIVSLLLHLDRNSFPNFSMSNWYKIAIELNIEPNLSIKKKELSLIAKGNAHKLLNQLQTVLSDISRVYLKTPPEEIAFSLKETILSLLTEKHLSGQKVNELFYLEFWKESNAILLTKETGMLTKLSSLTNQLYPLKMSLERLIEEYEFALPQTFCTYTNRLIVTSSQLLEILGSPNLLGAQFSIGFHNSEYEYLNEILSTDDHAKISDSAINKLTIILPTLISFLETYQKAKPLISLHVLKEKFEHLFSPTDSFNTFTNKEIKEKIEEEFTFYLGSTSIDFSLLEAAHHKIVEGLEHILNEIDPITTEYRILQEKLFSFKKIDLPSFAQTWHTLGEIFGVLFIYLSQAEKDLAHIKTKISPQLKSTLNLD
ncbi:MAG: hypothetical protein FJZ59_01220 [Chlamydiae bacterium]|nr:hypothetical protein [Chlamydiota bacterium]